MQKGCLSHFTPCYLGFDNAVASIENHHTHFIHPFRCIRLNTLAVYECLQENLFLQRPGTYGYPKNTKRVSCLSFFMPFLWDRILGAVLVQLEWTAWKLSTLLRPRPLYMVIEWTFYSHIYGVDAMDSPMVGLHRGGRRFESCSAHHM